MLGSLRARLIVSFALVVALAVFLAGAGALFLLRDKQEETARERYGRLVEPLDDEIARLSNSGSSTRRHQELLARPRGGHRRADHADQQRRAGGVRQRARAGEPPRHVRTLVYGGSQSSSPRRTAASTSGSTTTVSRSSRCSRATAENAARIPAGAGGVRARHRDPAGPADIGVAGPGAASGAGGADRADGVVHRVVLHLAIDLRAAGADHAGVETDGAGQLRRAHPDPW